MAKPRAYHDTPICIATQAPSSQALTRAPLSLRVSRPYRGLSRPYRGRVPSRIMALAACPCAPTARPVSRYNALYHDQVQNGQKPSQLPALFFFFTSFFFSFQLLENHQKKNFFFFHFPVEPNKSIKKKKKFPVLHTVKPEKKQIFFNTVFFLCAIHQAHKPYNSQHMIT